MEHSGVLGWDASLCYNRLKFLLIQKTTPPDTEKEATLPTWRIQTGVERNIVP
jgi:hypothetical protein